MLSTNQFAARLIGPRVQAVAVGAIFQIVARSGVARGIVDNAYGVIECGQEMLVIDYLFVEMRADLVDRPGRQIDRIPV